MFQGFLTDTEEEYQELWEKALIVVDTNVLINLYKYTTKDTYKTFFDILKDLKDKNRLFIPHQVALEYFYNYEKNMNLQQEGYKKLANKLMCLKESANTNIKSIESEYPFLKIDDFKFFVKDLEEANKKVKEQLDKELESLPDVKEVENNIIELLDNIVGQSYNQKKIETIQKDGEYRFLYKVPPGWEDDTDPNKQGFRTYGSMMYQQKYGDLIMWHQMMDKAKASSKPIIFITEEKKEDWWEKDKKAIKRPQPHLIQEFFEVTKQKFNMFRIERFVENAKTYLNIQVSKEQIENLTTQVRNIRKIAEKQLDQEYKLRKKLNVSDLFQYLNDGDKATLDIMLESSNDINLDGKTANFRYNKAIEWALLNSLPKLEDRVRELGVILTSYNPAMAATVFFTLKDLPKNVYQRSSLLLDAIDFAESKIDIYQGQGY